MRRNDRRFRRGGAVLEAALVLPVLLGLGFGTVEFGHFFFIKHNMQGAASAGVRAAVPGGSKNSDVAAAVGEVMAACGLQGSQYTVTTSPADVSGMASGAKISVTVECDWGTVGVRPLGVIGTAKKVRGVATMRRD